MAAEEKIKGKVMRIVAENFGVDESTLTRETDLDADLGATSLHYVSLADMLEEEFLIMMQFASLRAAKTVGGLVDLLIKEVNR